MASFTTTEEPRSSAEKHHPNPHSGRPPICGEPAILPTSLVLTALRYANRPEIEPAEIRDVRCTLQAHPTGDHYAFVVETTAVTSAWTRWAHGAGPGVVLVLTDCPSTGPGSDQDETCSEYEGHHGGHTWQVNDPWRPTEPVRMTAARTRTRPRTLDHEPVAVTWARNKAGLTKRALAREVGISEQLIGEIESGWRNATPANLTKIADVLNCPLVSLERKRRWTSETP